MRKWLPFAVLAATLAAQDRPQFEVASVKECNPGDRPPPSVSSPGRLGMGCRPLQRLILDAYEIFASGQVDPLNPLNPLIPLEGVPGWVNSARYTVDAKAEGPANGAVMRGPMMQALLEERFHLKMHHETREMPVYIMTVAQGGARLKPSQEGSCRHIDPTDFSQSLKVEPGEKPWCVVTLPKREASKVVYDLRGMSLDVFSRLLNPGMPILNRTGLTGTFDIYMETPVQVPGPPAPEGAASTPPGNTVILAMRDQLGLELRPGRGPVEFLVIDHIERPSGN